MNVVVVVVVVVLLLMMMMMMRRMMMHHHHHHPHHHHHVSGVNGSTSFASPRKEGKGKGRGGRDSGLAYDTMKGEPWLNDCLSRLLQLALNFDSVS